MYKISVIIPVYNSQETIVSCLSSVLSQTEKNIQIVIVDDGSTDASIKAIMDFFSQKRFLNFKIIRQENSGPGIARNTAIQNSDADLIAFLDSDDIWEEGHLKLLSETIEEMQADLVCTTKSINLHKITFITLNKLLYRCLIQSSTLIAKKEILLTSPFREGKRYSEDYDLWLRLSADKKTIVFLPIKDVKNCEDKRPFGDKGLSSALWKMEKNELENYKYLISNHKIEYYQYLFATIFSMLKFILRLCKTRLKI